MITLFSVLYRDFTFEMLTSSCDASTLAAQRSSQRRDETRNIVCLCPEILPFWKCLLSDFSCERVPMGHMQYARTSLCVQGAARCCREFEGAPQLHSSIPPRIGVRG